MSGGGRAELARVQRVADMLCTAHAGLAEDLERQALAFDVGVLVLSAWVASLALVDPRIAPLLVPRGLTPAIWIGLMGIAAFILTIIQMRLDLRGRADAHRRTFDAYAGVKVEAGRLLAMESDPDSAAMARVMSQHGFAASLGVGVPEKEFLRRKQDHLLKVRNSKFLSEHPSASLRLFGLKMWWKDNVRPVPPRDEGRRDEATPIDGGHRDGVPAAEGGRGEV